ncbi:hypothetical protein [Pseudomonas syringae]|uniref:hypothetical protein n=1 Tax=Pseudomonas syringae TaxID=317 RepID=UPI0012AEC5B5|nr:hypothetical protein [Pseudomonas syringae]
MAFISRETVEFLTYVEISLFKNCEWNTLYKHDGVAPVAGIYRCQGCGHEFATSQGLPFPQSHEHPSDNARKIQWRLIIKANQKRFF